MSKALKYLTASRPEAMEAYFSFLKANGQSLDPKTRALISVITKVANQTEAGLKQYARKALDVGATESEILDAILMAFSALGLTKTLWAIDILLSAGILSETGEATTDSAKDPKLRDSEQEEPRWSHLCALDACEDNSTRLVEHSSRAVFVSRTNEKIRAFDARCPHHDTNLAAVNIAAGQVECPLHGWRFDLSSGSCIRGGRDLTERKIKVEDGQVYVQC